MSCAIKNGLPWSSRDIRRLREMAAAGKTAVEVAKGLNRTRIGVKSKAASLGITLRSTRNQPMRSPSRWPWDLSHTE